MSRRGCLWFAGGLLLAMMAGIMAFLALQRVMDAPKATEEPARVPVLVAARDIPLYTVLEPADVTLWELPPEAIPEGGLADPQEALGQLTTVHMTRGEVILPQRLLKPDYVGPKAAFVMDPTQVIVAFPTSDLLTSVDIIRPGDHVDIMFSFVMSRLDPDLIESAIAMTVLQDVRVAAVVRGAAPASEQTSQAGAAGALRALLFALDPQDALVLKYFRDTGGGADLALRSPAASGLFDVVPVDGDYLLKKYNLRGRVKQ